MALELGGFTGSENMPLQVSWVSSSRLFFLLMPSISSFDSFHLMFSFYSLSVIHFFGFIFYVCYPLPVGIF